MGTRTACLELTWLAGAPTIVRSPGTTHHNFDSVTQRRLCHRHPITAFPVANLFERICRSSDHFVPFGEL